jgi:hypothetical protein
LTRSISVLAFLDKFLGSLSATSCSNVQRMVV